MSLTRLRDAESCPRRVALSSAEYPEIWDRRGYPPKFSLPAFVGQAVHAGVEYITAELRKRGCGTAQEPGAVDAMRALGGYTRVAEQAVERLLAENAKNPRFVPYRETATQMARNQLPEIRRRIQSLMCQIKLGAIIPASTGTRPATRRALGPGAYSEVWLEVPELGWAGKADQIMVSDDGAEISELKSGEPSPEHSFQLKLYALLWKHDRVLNPSGRSPTALHLRYLNRTLQVPVPSDGELNDLAEEITTRTKQVRAALGSHPPPARYHQEECLRCEVRHLCDEYWQHLRRLPGQTPVNEWTDVEIVVLGLHGPLSYDARIERAMAAAAGNPALLRLPVTKEYSKGERLRIIHASVTRDDETDDKTVIIRVGALSEVFRVSSS